MNRIINRMTHRIKAEELAKKIGHECVSNQYDDYWDIEFASDILEKAMTKIRQETIEECAKEAADVGCWGPKELSIANIIADNIRAINWE